MDELKQVLRKKKYFIIAEIGMNHDGSFGNALRLIEEAKDAKVDAVKFQLHISEEESLKDAPKPPYFQHEERYEYFERTSFSKKEWEKLRKYSHDLGLYFIVSPFSCKAVDFLEDINVDAYKIASGETTNLPLLEYINSKKKPVLMSTGMSNWSEIYNAIQALKESIVVLFQCSSEYPCSPENVGLNIIVEMTKKFPNLLIGYSDHTLSNYTSIAAFIMGARIFEKHFTLSKKMYGPDAKLSLEPKELKLYKEGIEFICNALNNSVDKDNLDRYTKMKYIFEKSIIASKDLKQGHIIKFEDLAFKKPGDGIRADKYKDVIGKKILKTVYKDEKIHFEDLIM